MQVITDEHSGFVAAFPSKKHDIETVTRNLLAFLRPSYHTNPVIMCKSDNAKEFQASYNILGFVHEPTLARRWPHNAQLERDIRSLEEITRSVHLAAGFHVAKDIWKHLVANAGVVMNQYHPLKGTADGEPSNRFIRAPGNEFSGREVLLDQLVYVRKDPLERDKFDAAASPACLLVGDLIQDRCHSRTYTTCSTMKAFGARNPVNYSIATAIPCEKVYVPEGPPVLPLKAAADEALAIFKNPNPEQLKPERQARQCQCLTSLLKPCLMPIHPNCLLVRVSHQISQKPLCQPKQIRNLMKSSFKQMQIEENIRECINHQVLIPSLNMHVTNIQPLVML